MAIRWGILEKVPLVLSTRSAYFEFGSSEQLFARFAIRAQASVRGLIPKASACKWRFTQWGDANSEVDWKNFTNRLSTGSQIPKWIGTTSLFRTGGRTSQLSGLNPNLRVVEIQQESDAVRDGQRPLRSAQNVRPDF